MAGSGPGSEVKVKTWLQALLGVLVRHFVERLQFGYSVFFSRSDWGLGGIPQRRGALLISHGSVLKLARMGFPEGSGTRKGRVRVFGLSSWKARAVWLVQEG